MHTRRNMPSGILQSTLCFIGYDLRSSVGAGGYTSFLSHPPHGSWRARSSLYITSSSWRRSPRPDRISMA